MYKQFYFFLMGNWVQQGGGRHRPLCDWYRPLYGAQSQFDTELSAAVQEPSSVAMQQLMSSALQRAIPPWHGTECSCEGAVIGRYAAMSAVVDSVSGFRVQLDIL
jgi:hypothetical protein